MNELFFEGAAAPLPVSEDLLPLKSTYGLSSKSTPAFVTLMGKGVLKSLTEQRNYEFLSQM